MGLFDKVKKILFDEDEVDVPVKEDKLPERVPKRKIAKNEDGGIINYHDDEDTIKEVHVPKEVSTPPVSNTSKSFNFPMDVDDDIPKRTGRFDYPEEEPIKEEVVPKQPERPAYNDAKEEELKRARQDLLLHYKDRQAKIDSAKKEVVKEEPPKVPFKVPPVISPVFGIIDNSYDPSNYEETRKKIIISNSTNISDDERQYGPVSYNDQPIPKTNYYKPGTPNTLKQELVSSNSTLDDMVNDDIEDKDDDSNLVERKIETKITEKYAIPDKEDIEDAFDSTDEYEAIKKNDEKIIDERPEDIEEEPEEAQMEPRVNINDLIENDIDEEDKKEENPDNAKLDDTIETDLFNLIDSMYKDDDKKEE